MPPTDRTIVAHERGEACGMAHCDSHNLDEHIGSSYYIVCLKGCNHVYKTADELLDTYNGIMRQAGEEARAKGWEPPPFEDVIDPDEIRFCPLCQEEL